MKTHKLVLFLCLLARLQCWCLILPLLLSPVGLKDTERAIPVCIDLLYISPLAADLSTYYLLLSVHDCPSLANSREVQGCQIEIKGLFTPTTITIKIRASTLADDIFLFIISTWCSYCICRFKCLSSLKQDGF